MKKRLVKHGWASVAELKKATAFAFSIRAALQMHSDATDEKPSWLGVLNSLRVSEKTL